MPYRKSLSKEIFNTLPAIFKFIKEAFRSSNIFLAPSQIKILHLIHYHTSSIKSLAQQCHVTPPTISEAINTLVEKGLVKKIHSAEDKRVVTLRITKKGNEEMEKAHKAMMHELDKQLCTLKPKERKILFDSMQILQNIFLPNKEHHHD